MPKLNTYPTLADLPAGFRFIGYNPGDGSVFDTNAVPRNVMRDFILSVVPVIKGDDGDQVELRANETHLQWRYVGDPAWIDLVPLSLLKGAKGDNGDRIQLQATTTYIQWKFESDVDWVNLVPLSALKGEKGEAGTGLKNRGQWVTGTTYQPGDYVFDTGSATASSMWILSGDTDYLSSAKPSLDLTHWVEFVAPAGQDGDDGNDGREIEIRKGSTALQWRYTTNDATWKDIITLAELKGEPGVGTPGTDGKSAEWQKSATHIQWRLVGDTTWINIVALTDIKGDVGATGRGVPAGGAAGYILSKTSITDFDTQWIVAPTGGGGGSGDVTKAGDNVFTGKNYFGAKPTSPAPPADPAGLLLGVWGPALFAGSAEFRLAANLSAGYKIPAIVPATPAAGVATLAAYNLQQKVAITEATAALTLKLPDASGNSSGSIYEVIPSGSVFRVFFPFDVTALTVQPGKDTYWYSDAVLRGAPTSVKAGFMEIQYFSTGEWFFSPQPPAVVPGSPFSKYFESPATAWTVGGLLSFNPGFDPKLTSLECVVTVATANSAVGDRFDVPMFVNTNYQNAQVVTKTATATTVRCGTAMVRMFASISGDQLTPSNSRLVLRAWG